jgi:hypothetical protein
MPGGHDHEQLAFDLDDREQPAQVMETVVDGYGGMPRRKIRPNARLLPVSRCAD